jgi:tRNA threonylcarbamoyladenosine biosynthesis protein TsaE
MTPITLTFTTHSPDDTQRLAAAIGRAPQGGECLALEGDLGAGKTCFVQGLAEGLDVPPDVYVRSPTFALLDEYPGRFTIFHLDLYRLEHEDDLEEIGWRDCFGPQSVVAVEWPNKIPDAIPHDAIHITIHIDNADTRIITLHIPNPNHPLTNLTTKQIAE